MKTLRILASLSTNELKKLDGLIASQKREVVKLLYKQLKRRTDHPDDVDREVLFEKVFKEKYVKNKDYLLRDAIRHLNEILYTFIMDTEYAQQVKEKQLIKQRLLVDAYKRRRLFKEQDEELKKAMDLAYKQRDYENLVKFKYDYCLAHNETKKITSEMYASQLEMINDSLDTLKADFMIRYRLFENFKIYTNRRLQEVQDVAKKLVAIPVDVVGSIIDFSDVIASNPAVKFSEFRIKAQTLSGRESIEARKQMLIYAYDAFPGNKAKEVYSANCTNIAMRLLFLGEFEEAEQFSEQAIELNDELGEQSESSLIAILYIKLGVGKYQEVLTIYQQYAETIKTLGDGDTINAVLAYSHLFLNDPKTAIKYASFGLGNKSDEAIVYSIAAYLDKDYEGAEREMANLEKVLSRSGKPKTGHVYQKAALVKKFMRAFLEVEYEQGKKLLTVQKALFRYKKEHASYAYIKPSYLWIKNELEKLGYPITDTSE